MCEELSSFKSIYRGTVSSLPTTELGTLLCTIRTSNEAVCDFFPTADDHDSVEQGHFPSCAGNLNRIQKRVLWQLASALISVARQTDIIVVSSNLTIRGGDDEHVVHLIKLESTQTHAHPRSSQSYIATIVIRNKADN